MDHDAWKDFFVAVSGAASALTGLVFVALSINLTKIISGPGLATRAAEALIILAAALLASLLAVIPNQSAHAIGTQLLVVGGIAWLVPLAFQIQTIRRKNYQSLVKLVLRVVLHWTSMLAIAGSGILLGAGLPSGAVVLSAGVLIALGAGLANSWILLIEIER